MKIEIARNDRLENYKIEFKDRKYENEVVKILNNYGIAYKKVNYFENFFAYKLLKINSEVIEKLKEDLQKYISHIRPISYYSLPIRIDREEGEVSVVLPEENKNYVTLGVLDNGIAKIKNLDKWIIGTANDFSLEDTSMTHGTFVSGIALYGDELEGKEIVKNEPFNLFDATVLGKNRIEEDDLIFNIATAIEKHHSKARIWNLSLSVKLDIEDERFSDFGVVLDYFQKKYSILICKSGGNGGSFMKKKPKKRLYHGSDSLLALVVSSITNEGNSSNFSRLGLGVGGTLKPDVASYGGNLSLEEDGSMGMNGVFSLSIDGEKVSSSGTSFANARIASLATIIYQNICKDFVAFSDFNPLLIKALIIHSAEDNKKGLSFEEIGFGIPKNSEEILSYFEDENIKIINSSMAKKYEVYPAELFTGDEFLLKITLVYDTEFDFYQKEKYIQSEIKVKKYSQEGVNLVRKFNAKISKNEKIELYSENEVEKKFTMIVQRV